MSAEQFWFAFFLLVMFLGVPLYFYSHMLGSARRFFIVTIIKFIGISALTTLFFSFVYLMFVVIEIGKAQESLNSAANLTSDMIDSFKGFDFSEYKNNPYMMLYDLLCFSASVFFHSQSRISAYGYAQFFVAIESVLGVLIPFIFTISAVRNFVQENKENVDSLTIYLNRGWNIYKTQRVASLKDYIRVDIISPQKETKPLLLKNGSSVEDLIRHFQIIWEKAELDMIPYFALVLEDELVKEKNKLSVEAFAFYTRRKLLDEQFFVDFYAFMEELFKTKSRPFSPELQSALYRFSNLIKIQHLSIRTNTEHASSANEVLEND